MKRGEEADDAEEAGGETGDEDGGRIGGEEIGKELEGVGAHGEEEYREAHEDEADAAEGVIEDAGENVSAD